MDSRRSTRVLSSPALASEDMAKDFFQLPLDAKLTHSSQPASLCNTVIGKLCMHECIHTYTNTHTHHLLHRQIDRQIIYITRHYNSANSVVDPTGCLTFRVKGIGWCSREAPVKNYRCCEMHLVPLFAHDPCAREGSASNCYR